MGTRWTASQLLSALLRTTVPPWMALLKVSYCGINGDSIQSISKSNGNRYLLLLCCDVANKKQRSQAPKALVICSLTRPSRNKYKPSHHSRSGSSSLPSFIELWIYSLFKLRFLVFRLIRPFRVVVQMKKFCIFRQLWEEHAVLPTSL